MSPRASLIFRSLAALPLAASTAHAQPLTLPLESPDLKTLDNLTPAWTFDHENILGTSMQLILRAPASLEAHRAEAAVLATIDRYSAILSAWNPRSEFSRWAATRGQAVQISPELFNVLSLFDHWRTETAGAIDASAQAAIQLWRTAAAEHRLPNPVEIAATVAAIQQPHWQLDPAAGTATRLSATPLVLATFAKSYIASHAADAALNHGASGVLLNLGGDIVLRGNLTQTVAIADPFAHAENDAPLDTLLLRDRAIATSGSYRRSLSLTPSSRQLSHIVDPRTALPTGHIASSTVIAQDPSTAGALATAFSVLSVDQTGELAARTPGVDYLLVASNGDRIASEGWQSYRAPTLRSASYVPAQGSNSAMNGYELTINLEITQSAESYRYRRPYVAVWVEDENHFPVRTIALWYGRDRWLPELRAWYHDDQVRYRAENTNIASSISSATRAPGKYTLKWDGKDDRGKPVKPGKYTIYIEAAREHGSYQLLHQEIDLNAGPREFTLAPGTELGAITLDYRKQ